MIDKYIPKKYNLCHLFDIEDLGELCLGLSTAKELHYIAFAKNNRILKKYSDRLLRRAEAYLQFIKAENRRRGNWDFLRDGNIVMVLKKNRFICFKVAEEMSTDKIILSEEEHTLNQEGS